MAEPPDHSKDAPEQARHAGADGEPPAAHAAPLRPVIKVDADACPVMDEIYRVAERYRLAVTLVANSFMRVPRNASISLVVVDDGFDAADDHIAAQAGHTTIVVTADILLAERCLKADATVIAPNGKPFTQASIGPAIAARAIMADLRAGAGADKHGRPTGGGPPPFSPQDRSRFLSALDEAATRLLRG